ncbi:MAG: hypothetical protein ACOX44_11570 [Limnochordia bacterium]
MEKTLVGGAFLLVYTLVLLSMFSVVVFAGDAATGVNLLSNPSFEIIGDPKQPPPGWMLYRGKTPDQMWVEKGLAVSGEYALVIDTGGTAHAGMRSIPVPAQPGDVYVATATVFPSPGSRPVLYLEYWDSNDKQTGFTKVTARGKGDDWETLTLTLEAPAGTTQVSLYFYSNATQSPGKVVWDDASLVCVERAPNALADPKETAVVNPPTGSRVFYVAPNGNDAAAGSADQPWQSLQKASTAAQAGDTVIFLPGTYSGVLAPHNSGTATAPITYKAQQQHTAVFVGTGSSQLPISIQGVKHIQIEGLRIEPVSERAGWVEIKNASHIRLANLIMQNTLAGSPLFVSDSQQIQILDSVIRRFAPDVERTRTTSVTTNLVRFVNCKHVLFAGNSISRAMHTALAFLPPEDRGNNEYIVVRGNVFHNGWGRNYEFFATAYVLFENNIVTNALRGAFSASSQDKFSPIQGIFRFNRVFANWGAAANFFPSSYAPSDYQELRVYHNVFDANAEYGLRVTTGLESNQLFINNIITNNDRHGQHIQVSAQPQPGLRMSHNAVWAEFDQDMRSTVTTQSQQRNLLSQTQLNVDPGYQDPSLYHHDLKPDSALIDAGQALTYTTTAGQGTVLPVADAGWFYDGFGIEGEVGDLIVVGESQQPARIVQVDYSRHQLHLDRAVSWSHNDPVGFAWSGKAPDIGVYEHGPAGRPQIQVKASVFEATVGTTVYLQAIVHGTFQPQQYTWQIGTHTFSAGPEVNIMLDEPGEYGIRVRVTDAEGLSYIGTAFLVVRTITANADKPLLHTTFDADDHLWWKFWKTYRPRPTLWEHVVDVDTGQGYLSVLAPEEEAGAMPAWIYPAGWNLESTELWWDIDKYPFVRIRYSVDPGTAVGLYLQAFGPQQRYAQGGGDEYGVYQAQVAATPAHWLESAEFPIVGNAVLLDDGAWHELTIDVRRIREAYPDVQVLQGIGFETTRRLRRSSGAYHLDDVAILPAHAGDALWRLALRTLQDAAVVTGELDVRIDAYHPEGSIVRNVQITLGEQQVYTSSSIPEQLALDTRTWPDGDHSLQVLITAADGGVYAALARVTLDNWTEVVDELQPPVINSFWGTIDRSRTSDASPGWVYVTQDEAYNYAADARMARVADTTEYLEWEVPALARFAAVVWVQGAMPQDAISFQVSADRNIWTEVDFQTSELESQAERWRILQLQGVPDSDCGYNWIRLVLHAQAAPEYIPIEIDSVHLWGARQP